MGRPLELPVGVGSPVGFLSGDIGVSLCTTDSLVRFSELAPLCAPLLLFTSLATSDRKGHDKDHEDDRDRDYDNDDAGAHPACPLNRPKRDDTAKGSERRGYATGQGGVSAPWASRRAGGARGSGFFRVSYEALVSRTPTGRSPP
jgi:hypothetical protein